jgi:hypothetical protein
MRETYGGFRIKFKFFHFFLLILFRGLTVFPDRAMSFGSEYEALFIPSAGA